MKVKKILTFKSGNFAFSSNYSQTKTEPLEIEFRLLYQSLKVLPILPTQAHEFEQELTRRSIFSTAAIEGNPLKEDEVAEIIKNQPNKKYLEAKKIEIKNDSRVLGEQKVHLLNPKTAFKISALKKHISLYEQHLQLFLQHTSLMAIQWINFNNHSISFKTILNK